METTLAVQQYIQQLIRKDPANIDLILKMPDAQDEGIWKYEHLRFVFTTNTLYQKTIFINNINFIIWRQYINFII